MSFTNSFLVWLRETSPIKFCFTVAPKHVLRGLFIEWLSYTQPTYEEVDDLTDVWEFKFHQIIKVKITYSINELGHYKIKNINLAE